MGVLALGERRDPLPGASGADVIGIRAVHAAEGDLLPYAGQRLFRQVDSQVLHQAAQLGVEVVQEPLVEDDVERDSRAYAQPPADVGDPIPQFLVERVPQKRLGGPLEVRRPVGEHVGVKTNRDSDTAMSRGSRIR